MKFNKIFPAKETISREYITVMVAFTFIVQDLESLFVYRYCRLYCCNNGKRPSGYALLDVRKS